MSSSDLPTARASLLVLGLSIAAWSLATSCMPSDACLRHTDCQDDLECIDERCTPRATETGGGGTSGEGGVGGAAGGTGGDGGN